VSTKASENLRAYAADIVHEHIESDAPPEVLVKHILSLCASVHQNGVMYGQLLGEERVLTAVLDGLTEAGTRTWLDATKDRIAKAKS
jgi:hypothetical protein